MKKTKGDCGELDPTPKKLEQGYEKVSEDKIKWANFVSEGDVCMRQYEYAKAVEFYSKALQIEPNHVHVLTSRAKARNNLGNSEKAEKDADMVLSIDPKSPAGHMCKAKALFNMGEFEMALLWYVRGQRVPLAELDMLQEFKHGEFQCRSAIEKAMESFDTSKLKLLLDKKKLLGEKVHFDPNSTARKKPVPASQYQDYSRSKKGIPNRISLTGNNAQIAQNLLEELYDDYAFLRDLESSTSIRKAQDPVLNSHISGAINYLEDRLEFWRARNPKALHDVSIGITDSVVKVGKQSTRMAKYLKETKVPELGKCLQVLPKIGDY